MFYSDSRHGYFPASQIAAFIKPSMYSSQSSMTLPGIYLLVLLLSFPLQVYLPYFRSTPDSCPPAPISCSYPRELLFILIFLVLIPFTARVTTSNISGTVLKHTFAAVLFLNPASVTKVTSTV